MPPKHKSSKAATPPDQRLLIKGLWLGVPATFFSVETDAGRYLAKATGPHKSKNVAWFGCTSRKPATATRRMPL